MNDILKQFREDAKPKKPKKKSASSKRFMQICRPLHNAAQLLKHPTVPEYALPSLSITGTSTNKLEKQIVAFIQLHGWQAERIKNMGTARIGKDKRVTFTPSSGTRGTADISATINGKSVKIEVKNKATNDKMSEAQKEYQRQVELTGGLYYIARDIDYFIDWYQDRFDKHPEWVNAVMFTYK